MASTDRHRPSVRPGAAEESPVARLRIPDGRYLTIDAGAAEHPIFGVCDCVAIDGEAQALRFAAIDWERPGFIPPLETPGALPAGAGTAILNHLAERCMDRPERALRYRGPYPTAALFDALLECFRVGEPAIALRLFTESVEERAIAARMDEVPVDFVPAPFTRVWHEAGPDAGEIICVQLRRGVERVFIAGRAYGRDTIGMRRLIHNGAGWSAALVIGGSTWAEVARIGDAGELVSGPERLPAVTGTALGRTLPAGVCRTMAAVLPERAPRLMRGTLHQVLTDTPVRWGDTGDQLAIFRQDPADRAGWIELHAAMLEILADRPAQLMNEIAAAVEPIAQRLAQHRMAERIAAPGSD
ncbi:MAG: hypothetical protein AAGC55_15085 [Myxococcota bacterium]